MVSGMATDNINSQTGIDREKLVKINRFKNQGKNHNEDDNDGEKINL